MIFFSLAKNFLLSVLPSFPFFVCCWYYIFRYFFKLYTNFIFISHFLSLIYHIIHTFTFILLHSSYLQPKSPLFHLTSASHFFSLSLLRFLYHFTGRSFFTRWSHPSRDLFTPPPKLLPTHCLLHGPYAHLSRL